MDIVGAAADFTRNYWQGMIAVIALAVAIQEYRLLHREAAIQHFAHVVDFGPLSEELSIPNREGQFRVTIQLSNPTGSPQIVRDLWLRPIEYEDLDDQQSARLVQFYQMAGSVARDYFAQPVAKANFEDSVTASTGRGRGILEVFAGLLNMADRLTTGKVTVRGKVRYMDFMYNAMLRDLGQLAKPKSDNEIRGWADRILAERDPIEMVAPEERMPLTKSVNVKIQPKSVGDVEVDFSQFSETCRRALSFIGGKFTFTCVLEARVHRGDDVQSDLFELKVEVATLDLDVYGAQMRKALGQELRKESR